MMITPPHSHHDRTLRSSSSSTLLISLSVFVLLLTLFTQFIHCDEQTSIPINNHPSLINKPTTITNSNKFVKIDSTQNFIDPLNRTKIFHGVNVVYKIPPFYPDINTYNSNTSLTQQDLKNLHKWGFNVIRLYLSWEGVESKGRGQYNLDYLKMIKQIVKMCERENIMVILDVHQDVMSDLFCGEGFPRWAVQYNTNTFPFPFGNIHLRINETTGAPLVSDCIQHAFFQYYLTRATSNAFQNFYDNVNGLRDAFADFWKFSANYFKDETNVLGLEYVLIVLSSSCLIFYNVCM